MKRSPIPLVVLALSMILLLAACVRPLREEETTVQPEAPAAETPAEQLLVPTVAPPSEGEGEPADTGAQEGEASGGETPAEPAGGETATPTDEGAGGEAETPSSSVIYLVQAGDTLSSVAQRYNLTGEQLAAANNLAADAALVAGQQLVVPLGAGVVEQPAEATPTETPRTTEIIHVVQPGENLFRIGLQYGIPYQELAAYNGIVNPAYINVGQEIRIPPEQ